MQKVLPVRKNIRLREYDYSLSGYYFVTICAKDGHELFGSIDVGATVPGRPCPRVILTSLGESIDSAIRFTNKNDVSIEKYVIMPNHIHMVIALSTGDRGRATLQYVIRNIKSYVSKQAGFSPWQKSFHDYIIRSKADYQRIWKYIDENPSKWQEDCYFTSE